MKKSKNRKPTKLAYTIEEVAKLTSISRGKVYEALNDGSLAGRKCGNRTVIRRADVKSWLEGLPIYPRSIGPSAGEYKNPPNLDGSGD